MTLPTCPQDYTCTFTRLHPRVVNHTLGPWYQHTAGWIVAVIAILAIASVLAWLISNMTALRAKREAARERELERQREREYTLAIEEQRTLQADAAKGDPEMLKLIRQRI
jgi:hypothetical protein